MLGVARALDKEIPNHLDLNLRTESMSYGIFNIVTNSISFTSVMYAHAYAHQLFGLALFSRFNYRGAATDL